MGITLEEHTALHDEADAANAAPANPAKAAYKKGSTSALPPAEAYPQLDLSSVLDFGKHKGQQVEDLMIDEPDYLKWMCEKKVRFFTADTLRNFKHAGII